MPTSVIASAEAKQQHREHARRGSGPERKSAHALQVARCPQREQRERDQRDAAEKILRPARPTKNVKIAITSSG